MIGHPMPFPRLGFLGPRPVSAYFSERLAQPSQERFLASLRYKCPVIFALPLV